MIGQRGSTIGKAPSPTRLVWSRSRFVLRGVQVTPLRSRTRGGSYKKGGVYSTVTFAGGAKGFNQDWFVVGIENLLGERFFDATSALGGGKREKSFL